MGGKYICQYPSNEGEVCGQGSNQPEGCYIHRKRRYRPPCKQSGCALLTASGYRFCKLHVNKCYSNEYYHRKKLEKMRQNG
jgi:hypothetical protein